MTVRLLACRLLSIVLCLVVLPCVAQDELRLHGSNTVGQRVAPVLVTAWMRSIGYADIHRASAQPGRLRITGVRDERTLAVDIVGAGSAAGFRDLINGDAEIAMMARPLTARERDAGWQLGNLDSPDQEFVLSVQALVAVVNARNPLHALSPAQLAAIARGRVRNWQELGGRSGPIHSVGAPAGSGLDELQAQVMGAPLGVGATRVPTPAAVLAAVAADPDAIGWLDYRQLSPGVRALAIHAAGRDIAPDAFGVASEDYPLSRRLVFRTGQLVTALGRSFVNFAVSDAGQRALAAQRLVALLPAPGNHALPPAAPAEYAQAVAGAQRLPMILRFGDAFSILDSRSSQDVLRLQTFMQRTENHGRRLILIGFSGQDTTPYQAVARSTERADLAAQALAEVGLYPMRVRGLGQAATPDPARDPLRVEVWLR